MTASADEEIVSLLEAARRLGERPENLRRRLTAAQVVRLGAFEVELRTSHHVALRRVGRPVGDEVVPRWRQVAERAREELRRAAARGDRAARRALLDAGESLPHWSERDDDAEGA